MLAGLTGGLFAGLGRDEADAAKKKKKKGGKGKKGKGKKGCPGNKKKCGNKCIKRNLCCRNSDCPANQICTNQNRCRCRQNQKRCGQRCIGQNLCCTDDECQPVEICQDGQCVVQACTNNAECRNDVCSCGTNPSAGVCQAPTFSQNFNNNLDGWFAFSSGSGGLVNPETDGTMALQGGAATIAPGIFANDDLTAISTLGGYSNVFPSGGYTVELKIFIDPSDVPEEETRFDYCAAVSQPDCTHCRDFCFNAGVNEVNSEWTYCVTASNNSGTDVWPPCSGDLAPHPHEVLTQTGWYTFRHEFSDEGAETLKGSLVLLDPGGNELHTWELVTPPDIFCDAIGGNRYAWFPVNGFDELTIDDSSRVNHD